MSKAIYSVWKYSASHCQVWMYNFKILCSFLGSLLGQVKLAFIWNLVIHLCGAVHGADTCSWLRLPAFFHTTWGCFSNEALLLMGRLYLQTMLMLLYQGSKFLGLLIVALYYEKLLRRTGYAMFHLSVLYNSNLILR